MKNEKGFTLIEMLIVLLVISVLMIITIPNLTKNNGTIRDKGCEALVITAQAQAEAYSIENGAYPSNLSDLVDGQYLKQTTCPDGGVLGYDSDSGEVSAP
ncbi:competence protein ComG [Halobacillus halophilus]|uniref:ComG operon protein 3 n=1 Tax=Halobacillus halophilus (strain ATCC 35676 / DSM 2266 / JCM 20832 / KCTC 3685 / LMG 17431 / NBRC 102448 / NCIMB 2269) TaxID=866895 RepID=I0JNY4_HALH3|nr:competence type IV pilus major pilin ComGC [Halobacillus halophilus]ASF39898.1 competence protein ComG [Halobacillus halophilus]CCG45854.1 ComG operon protein 3 [Halobacillus halophilus DSM 2266]